jgi:hypothetical protein
MANITFSADKHAIDLAREVAREKQTTLNEEFRRWLNEYGQAARAARVHDAIEQVRKVVTLHGPFSRDELNARR